jgi:CheY-like chemotaxis protein
MGIVQRSNLLKDQPRVLLVDDSPENLISLEAALEGLGQELVTARSGMEALRHLLEKTSRPLSWT